MNWKLAFSIAVTHLVTKKKQSVIAMLGVTFGISMFIIMISFMTGVNQFTEDMAMDNTPHVRIYKPLDIEDNKIIATNKPQTDKQWYVVEHVRPKDELPKIKNGLKLAEQIESMPEVEGVAPQVSSQVIYNNGPVQIPGTIYGIDVEKQTHLFELDKKMDYGSLDDLLKASDVVVMGKGLAKKMNIKMGDRVSITTPAGNYLTLKVAGIFSFGIVSMDESRCYATLATVQKILGKDPSYITDLHIKLKDLNVAKPFAKRLEAQIKGVRIEDWETANASFFAGNQIRNIMTVVVCLTLLTVAGFGIYNIMNMNIINKMKDIAILKATGFQSNDITAIFLLQSVMIGLAGGLLGLIIGFFVSYLLSMAPFPAGDFVRMKTFPVNFKPVHYLFGLFFGFLTTLFAGYFPSKRASKVDPVQIIRG
ncbi:ABC transporter permease [Polluticoccus soli]|uniref:ABC transporter permease n=1 Tax=Polluticoccus soli TaxID=3034150 RepID=UPI0023E2684D|nr:ABC transporter permease [Flavipsychrobacter sp. JY13-12]